MAKKKDTAPDLSKHKQHIRKILPILHRRVPKKESPQTAAPFIDTLVAIILSQSTSDVNSHRAYQALRSTWPSWEEIAQAQPDELAAVIRVSGLAEQKTKAILNTLHAFQEEWGDLDLTELAEVPDDELIAFLTGIGGVGLKSATCAMMFALDRDLCAVDTHLHRILNRLGLIRSSSPDKTFRDLRPMIPRGRAKDLHVGLIHFGRDICKARLPHCFECPLYDICQWEEKEEHAAARKIGPKAVSGDFLITDGI